MPSAFINNQTTDMKKKRITYGVYGMMEYQAIIKIGRATLKVLFTDGSITSLGQNPAQYTTSDFIVQRAIESSGDFKRGRIKVVNVIELDEDVRIERNHSTNTQATPAKSAVNIEAATESAAPAKEAEATGTDETEATKEAEEAEYKTADEASAPTEVEFCTNQEAKDYLATTFGVKGALRTRAEIIAAGDTCGVKITFVND